MPSYKLTYFPVRGRAELARIIFHYTKTPFEDIRVKGEEWQALKKSKQTIDIISKCNCVQHVLGVAFRATRSVATQSALLIAGDNDH